MARNSLLQIRNQQSVLWKGGQGYKTLTATEWLLEVMMKPETADDRPVFRADNPELLGLLKLPENGKYFSFNQLKDQLDEINQQFERVEKIEPADRTAFETQVVKLQHALMLYQRLKFTLRPPDSDDFAAELAQFQKSLGSGLAAVRAREANRKYDEKTFDEFAGQFSGSTRWRVSRTRWSCRRSGRKFHATPGKAPAPI